MLDNECYRILGLERTASLEAVKASYRRMVKELHPDTGRNPDSIAFTRVLEAYRTLSLRTVPSRIIDFPVRESRPASRPAPRAARQTGPAAAKESIFEIGNLLLNGKTPHLRAFAAMRLGNSGRISGYSYLRKGLYDEDGEVVRASIQAIGKLKVQHSAAELGALFRRADLQTRIAILEAVGGMKNLDSFKPILLQGMRDGASTVRRKSLQLFKDYTA